MSQNLTSDLEILINRYIDCRASAQEVERLNQLLRSDAGARRLFSEHLTLDAAITAAAQCSAGEHAAIDDILAINERAISSTAYAHWAVAVAAVLLVAAGIWSLQMNAPTFATVVRGVGIESLADGTPLGGQLTRIEAGTLELVSVHGARIVIEAPAEFHFESGQRLNLAHGRLSAFVPETAKGFTVVTPTGDAIDLGTKFAVDVSSRNETEVHVFEGEVMTRARGSHQQQLLKANNAIRFRHANSTEACDVRHGTFVTAREMIPLAEALRLGQRERARAAAQALQQDPAVLAWLDFDRPIDGSRIERSAVIHGGRWVQGRFPGTGALDFVHSEDCVQLNLNVRVAQFTLMTWIRLNQLEGRSNSLYSTDEWGEIGQVHWMIGSADNVRFAIKGTVPNALGNSNVWLETQPRSMTALEHWVHLALVYDSEKGTATQYLNGEALMTAEMPKGLFASLGPAQLGNWKPQVEKAKEPRRRLSGRMDEFAAFSRPLTQAELSDYYEASKPYQ